MMLVGITGKKTENLRGSKLMDVDHVEFRELIKKLPEGFHVTDKGIIGLLPPGKLSNLK